MSSRKNEVQKKVNNTLNKKTSSKRNNKNNLKNQVNNNNTPKTKSKQGNNIKSVGTNKKKSNYHKVNQKILNDKKLQKVKEQKKKEIKQVKHDIKIKKQEEIKNRTFLKKIKLVLLSFLIKTRNFLKKIYRVIKSFFNKLILVIKKFFKILKNKKEYNKENKGNKKIIIKNKDKKNNDELIIENQENNQEIEEKKIDECVLKSLFGKELPLTFNKGDKKRRKTIYLKESLFLTLILTLIDVYCIYKTDLIDYLRIFDNNIFNITFTICLTLLVFLIIIFFGDFIITETILKVNKKKKNKTKKNKLKKDKTKKEKRKK